MWFNRSDNPKKRYKVMEDNDFDLEPEPEEPTSEDLKKVEVDPFDEDEDFNIK